MVEIFPPVKPFKKYFNILLLLKIIKLLITLLALQIVCYSNVMIYRPGVIVPKFFLPTCIGRANRKFHRFRSFIGRFFMMMISRKKVPICQYICLNLYDHRSFGRAYRSCRPCLPCVPCVPTVRYRSCR